jgi:hypothetical protein
MFPDSLSIRGGGLVFKGIYNGHAYYISDNGSYLWTESRDISGALGGHLVTITDSAENSFIYNNLRQPEDWGAWIGLYNTGTQGSFAWVTGEPFSYSNWNRNEPNNHGGNPLLINEPYVHILGYDAENRWNDIGNTQLRFIAEFESAVFTYRQLSGPENGSTQMPGVYTICYERSNTATGVKDTCCFDIRVVCNNTVATFCPPDTIITSADTDCTTSVSWTTPGKRYPDSININKGTLIYKGSFNNHGYYETNTHAYSWMESRDIAIGLGAHLVTITDGAENTFIRNNLPQADNSWGAWIGLYNTGTAGSFAWVTAEPVSYTNWNNNEPNNHGGSSTVITEPYVHILGYDFFDRWNDIGETNMKFIAEFDAAVYTYTQISGIVNGSMQAPGVYTICYERRNAITMEKDTCCFNITVNCPLTTNELKKVNEVQEQNIGHFNTVAHPNPSTNSFTLKVLTDNATEKLNVRVMDLFGRVVEVKNGLTPNSTIRLGGSYRPGVYFAQVIQGKRKTTIRLIKQ